MYQQKDLNGYSLTLADLPQSCPYCHMNISPIYVAGYQNDNRRNLSTFFLCPQHGCNNCFVAEYEKKQNGYFYFSKIMCPTNVNRNFDEKIKTLSPDFQKIYNEAFQAEQYQLNEICGVGYRKSLEFLIKDYLCSKAPNESERIKNMFLGKCISDLVTNDNLRNIAKRATWLGNDETHYVKKWENKDLQDLKKLIEVTLHWIEMEILTDEYISTMPE